MAQKKLLFVATLFISSFLLAQSHSSLKDHPIKKAAPHLPFMIRHEGSGNVYYGEKHKYQKEQNETKIKEWIKKYPSELAKYKTVTSTFFRDTDVSKLSEEQIEIYNDLKSQWIMIRQMQ